MKSPAIVSLLLAFFVGLHSTAATANGDIGEHVNQLNEHLDDYAEDVEWLISNVAHLVQTYESQGATAVDTNQVVVFWEAVEFHAAIETTYVPLYASIWQGLFAVKGAIDTKKPAAEVTFELAKLEHSLWQALGAVKMAAKFQNEGLLAQIQTTEAEPVTAVETINDIQDRLERVVAKHAEQLNAVAKNLVFDTYLHRFEGVEGRLIEQDVQIVEDLEKSFNVTLPKALDSQASVDTVRAIVQEMNEKLDRAKSLLEEADKRRKDVF